MVIVLSKFKIATNHLHSNLLNNINTNHTSIIIVIAGSTNKKTHDKEKEHVEKYPTIRLT